MANTIKGFKINDQKYGLNLTQIGSYIDSGSTEVEIASYIDAKIDENKGEIPTPTPTPTPVEPSTGATIAELISSDGAKFDLKVANDGELYAVRQENVNKLVKPTSETITKLEASLKVNKDTPTNEIEEIKNALRGFYTYRFTP